MIARTLGVVSLLGLAVTGQARDMTLMETVTAQSVVDVNLSPNGQFTAITKYYPARPYTDKEDSGKTELVIRTANGKETVYLSKEESFSDVEFGPNSEYIYFTAKRDGDDYSELYRIPLAGGGVQSVYEFDGSITAYDLSSDGQSLIFLSTGSRDKDAKKRG